MSTQLAKTFLAKSNRVAFFPTLLGWCVFFSDTVLIYLQEIIQQVAKSMQGLGHEIVPEKDVEKTMKSIGVRVTETTLRHPWHC